MDQTFSTGLILRPVGHANREQEALMPALLLRVRQALSRAALTPVGKPRVTYTPASALGEPLLPTLATNRCYGITVEVPVQDQRPTLRTDEQELAALTTLGDQIAHLTPTEPPC